MAKKKKEFNPKTKIMSALRKIWQYCPQRREVLKRATVKVDKLNFFRCEHCRKLVEKVQVDHIIPCVPVEGFDSWDNVIERMLYVTVENLSVKCRECHSIKTLRENKVRKTKKKLDKTSKE
jgi:5-methylcytosine-specific restriction endonuclease McrA